MNNKLMHILEIVWMSLAIISFVAGLYNWYDQSLQDSFIFFIITLLAILMYLYRRNLRRSQEP